MRAAVKSVADQYGRIQDTLVAAPDRHALAIAPFEQRDEILAGRTGPLAQRAGRDLAIATDLLHQSGESLDALPSPRPVPLHRHEPATPHRLPEGCVAGRPQLRRELRP